jgi:glycosyltransferase involved in cell wall biosynthesis
MKLVLITDAWKPQVNGVVTTLIELVEGMQARGHQVELIEPSQFKRMPCPGYREIELSLFPYAQVKRQLDAAQADAVHIATEGPLGSAARRWCLKNGVAFTTAFHTRFPVILSEALHIPESWGYAWFKRFHRPSAGVMVPTIGMREILEEHHFENLRTWSHGVDLSLFQPVPGASFDLPGPVWLYVGRVSYEKNLEVFLKMDLPGSKVVFGVGPLLDKFKREYPNVHWHGVVPRSELPRIYSAADVFVFPSCSETFGLVMLEALACGTPVAAFPVTGPLDVLGDSDGGVMLDDLRAAALQALEISPERALARARTFDWHAVVTQFMGHLVPARPGRVLDFHEKFTVTS